MDTKLLELLLLLLALCICSMNLPAVISCIEAERQSLLDFRKGLKDPADWLLSWSGNDCCQWQGLTCDNQTGHVVHLSIRTPYPFQEDGDRSHCISGEITPSLLHLSHLRFLDLSGNCFGGTLIPHFLGSIQELRYLNLSGAEFGGTVPPQLGNLSSLIYLDLSTPFPYDIELKVGSLHWLSQLTSLEYLDMSLVRFQEVSDWIQTLNMLPSLLHVSLHACLLYQPPSLPLVNFTSLSYLDLSSNFINTAIPEWVFNLSSLRHLDLSDNSIHGPLPSAIGNLQSVEVLDLSGSLQGGIPGTLKSLCKLKRLVLSGMNMSCDLDELRGIFSRCITNNLEALDFSYTNVGGYIPSWLGEMENLRSIYLDVNSLQGPLPDSFRRLSLMQELFVAGNMLNGTIPGWLGELKNLKVLDLSSNSFSGLIPSSLGGMSSLQELYLDINGLSGTLPDCLGELKNLRNLYLSTNNLYGSVPNSLGRLSSLQELKLYENRLDGTVSKGIGRLSNLVSLDLRDNSLVGVLTEDHFSNLSSLKYLDISSNSLSLNVSSDWAPSFQLEFIRMLACRLGPQFPLWLSSQRSVYSLYLSNTSITGMIPDWLWSTSPKLSTLDLSGNQITGEVPHIKSGISYLDLSDNLISGQIPLDIGDMMPNLESLSLSHNHINGSIPSTLCNLKNLSALDLSRNHISGELPSCWKHSMALRVLDLSNNNLSGGIHGSVCPFPSLLSLHLSKNNMSGELPSALKGCSQMVTLDFGHNKLAGKIPTWIGESLLSLQILSLRHNKFNNSIPSQLGHLEALQILDLSHNSLVGNIPKSFGNLSAMRILNKMSGNYFRNDSGLISYNENMLLMMKGRELEYDSLLSLVTILDLSDNGLSGNIPEELMNLVGLQSLNLSGNSLTGAIPERIGELQQVESLDFSRNELSDKIPSELSMLFFLSFLNLSYNNLSGRIPSGDQLQTLNDASIYIGNPNLCGTPLPKRCQDEESPAESRNADSGDQSEWWDERLWLYFGIAAGSVTGFWFFCGVLLLKYAWRMAFIRLIDKIYGKICSVVASNVAKLKRN